MGDDGEVEGWAVEEEEEVLVDKDVYAGRGQGVWDVFGHDYETADYFVRRYVRVLNTIGAVKGWVGFWRDLVRALLFRTGKRS